MGFLDAPFRELASLMTGMFTDTKARVKRVETVYDESTDVETKVPREFDVFFSPPTTVDLNSVSESSKNMGPTILNTDLVAYAAAEAFESASPPFDPEPGDGASVYVRIAGRDHSVIRVVKFASGDQMALFEFILRS